MRCVHCLCLQGIYRAVVLLSSAATIIQKRISYRNMDMRETRLASSGILHFLLGKLATEKKSIPNIKRINRADVITTVKTLCRYQSDKIC